MTHRTMFSAIFLGLASTLTAGAGATTPADALRTTVSAMPSVALDAPASSSGTAVPIAELRQRAATGNAAAEIALARRLTASKIPADQVEGVALYRKAAAQGNPDAEWLLGAAYFSGTGVPRDGSTGLAWMRKSLATGPTNARRMLAYGLLELSVAGDNPQDGVAWIRRSADAGSTEGMLFLAMFEIKGNHYLQADPVDAARLIRKAANLGNADAQTMVGQFYLNGNATLGFAPDAAEGLHWLDLAAQQGNSQAEGLLGVFLVTGKLGVPKDPATGVAWARKGATAHDPFAYYALGIAYQHGLGGEPTDASKAWYNFAAAQRMDSGHDLTRVALHLSEVGGKLNPRQLDRLQAEVNRIPLPKKQRRG